MHAHTREGKAQVELAQLNYLLPRLRGWGEAMSRLGGGIGTRGPGETKMESDRQHIRRRIAKLRRDVKAMQTTRDTQRASRQRSNMPQMAIAGYTNAGKSSLMRRLTGADVIVADQLFATLDPTTRRIVLPGGRRATLSRHGRVRRRSCPHDLVEAFRSTLEEVTLVGPDRARRRRVLAGAGRPDRGGPAGAGGDRRGQHARGAGAQQDRPAAGVPTRAPRAPGIPGSVAVLGRSPARGSTVCSAAIAETVPTPPVDVHALIPWDRGDLVAMLYRDAEVLSADAEPDGTRVHARVGLRELAAIRAFTTAVVASGRRGLAGRRSADRPERGVVPLARDDVVGVLPALGRESGRQELQPHGHAGSAARSGGKRGRLSTAG